MCPAAYFRQLRDAHSGCFSYVLADAASGHAVIVDPVLREVTLYLSLLEERALRLDWIVETHLHDDRVSGAWALRGRTRAPIAAGAVAGIDEAARPLADGERLAFGAETLVALATPGHTPGCLTYLWRDRAFTGDALLIGGCGRTDGKGASAGRLYDSVTRRLFPLPDETIVCPGRGSASRRVSCIGDERESNACFAGCSRDEFVAARLGGDGGPPGARTIAALNRRAGDPRALDPAPGASARQPALH